MMGKGEGFMQERLLGLSLVLLACVAGRENPDAGWVGTSNIGLRDKH